MHVYFISPWAATLTHLNHVLRTLLPKNPSLSLSAFKYKTDFYVPTEVHWKQSGGIFQYEMKECWNLRSPSGTSGVVMSH